MSYTVTDLRADMAATIKALREGDEKMTVEKAKAISELGQTMINSAKVEVDMIRAVGRNYAAPTGFIALETVQLPEANGQKPALESPPRPKPHVREPMGTGPRSPL
ncbi:MAG: hypothetical protein ACREO0_10925 [Pseudoxanthomonas sp.]